jgi:rare lipoprotein A (peptidoglycan hydrolase)
VTARAQRLLDDLEQASAMDGGLRISYEQTEQARADAQHVLGMRARQVYMASGTVPFGSWVADVAAPDLQELAHRGQRAALAVDQQLVDDVAAQSAQLARLQKQAEAFRAGLLVRAKALLAAQDRARDLYDQAAALAEAEHQAEVQRALEAQRDQLDDISTRTALSLTPGQQARARRALANEGPVVALLEATGSGIPAGYAPSGQVFSGIASWYGPGFVGNPTASGAPYDPERLTCAHKTLPLGTVLHVTANGRAVNCLVNDRGPYVDGRVLDMSKAGARALGYSGLAHVTAEVLLPVG